MCLCSADFPVPPASRKLCLALLMELGVQTGHLSKMLELIVLLLKLSANGGPRRLASAPLMPLLVRFQVS